MTKFKVGDRVVRMQGMFDYHGKLPHGIVTKIYQSVSKYYSYLELYEVQWDGKREKSRGYLPNGLSKEKENEG